MGLIFCRARIQDMRLKLALQLQQANQLKLSLVDSY